MLGYTETLASRLPDGETAPRLLHCYFPRLLRERFADHFARHPLKREIVATVAINQVINQAGIGFIPRVAARTGARTGEIVATYVVADAALDGEARRATILARDEDLVVRYEALLALEADIERDVLEALSVKVS
jgi:glutamate dehydrogenase